MTPEELAEVEERCRKATPGPWAIIRRLDGSADHGRVIVDTLPGGGKDIAVVEPWMGCERDAAFIAHARADVPALVAEVRRLREERDQAVHAAQANTAELARAWKERDEACAEVEAVSGYYCPQFVNQLKADIARLEHERDEAISNSMTPEARREYAAMILRDYRGVEDPCPVCDGWGIRIYPSTARWRGGIGGQAITPGVCDRCWGSGDGFKPWVSLREVEATRARVEKAEAEVARLREALDAAQRIVRRKADREAGREQT